MTKSDGTGRCSPKGGGESVSLEFSAWSHSWLPSANSSVACCGRSCRGF